MGGTSKGGGAKALNKIEEYTSFEGNAGTVKGKYNLKVFDETGEQQAVDFFNDNTNFDELISQMSDKEKYMFKDWSSGDFMFTASRLNIHGWDSLSPYEKEALKTFDKYIDKAKLSKGIEVVRLSDSSLLFGDKNSHGMKEFQALQDRIVNSVGNMSTSAAKEGLIINKKMLTKNVEYRFKIPSGSTGAGMWIGDDRINIWGSKQREYMLNRDTNWKVNKVSYNSKRGIYEAEMEYVSRNSHNYGG